MEFFFAWADADETTFTNDHIRYDDNIFSFTKTHKEGEFATLSIEIKNPRIGLLNASRKRWAWLSVNDGGTDVIPLFFGRLTAIPSDLFAEVITLEFVGRPSDYEDQKATLADSLKVLPWYDELFIDDARIDDPDTVLESRSAHWHIDPVSHAVTVSDVLIPEDGTVSFGSNEAFYDSVQISIGQNPLQAVRVQLQTGWTQTGTGNLTLGFSCHTYDGPGVLSSWPKPGASFGGGWTVESSSAVDALDVLSAENVTASLKYEDKSKEHQNGDLLSREVSYSAPTLKSGIFPVLPTQFPGGVSVETSRNESFTIGDPDTGRAASASTQVNWTFAALSAISATMVLRADAARDITETDTFILYADLQELLTDELTDSDIETVQLSAKDIGSGESPAIEDPSRGSYMPTSRGLQSIEYALLVARAHLRERARCVTVSWDCRFADAMLLTCRNGATLTDSRLPGGEATGKITTVTLTGSGDSGEFIGTIEIGVPIGKGNAYVGSDGDPTYVDADVLDDEVQEFAGQTITAPSSDVGFEIPSAVLTGDALKFPLIPSAMIVKNGITTGTADQRGVLEGAAPQGGAFVLATDPAERARAQKARFDKILADNSFTYEVELKSVQGNPVENIYSHVVGPLVIPQGIDLAAASG